ncbi:hypothetical protein BJ138DRAFT_1151708 [Hygrophoropsis aurantiaca]|uniref:Uncharacterized protein n=1 Tax=Hygrophoropsis aurantiaca TaxID=72124 RepID=A0ACB8ACZ8_9AGAM|nr:hypothetical protein BJ138DRAFT_1151708 [Hygrophoropsis aurantiaca]
MLHRANIQSTNTSLVIGPRLLAMYEDKGTITKDTIFIDVETCQRYQFPEQTLLDAGTQLKQTVGENYCFKYQSILTTSTHVLLIRYYGQLSPEHSNDGMLIEAYEVPSCQELVCSKSPPTVPLHSARTTLQLSHATLRADMFTFTDKDNLATLTHYYPVLALLRDSTFSSITGTTHITLTSNTSRYVCIIPLRLDPRPDNGIGSITFEPSKSTIPLQFAKLQPSYNGHTRAVTAQYSGPPVQNHLVALDIDDEGLATTWTSSTPHEVPRFPGLPLNLAEFVVAYDMYRGRFILQANDPDALRVLDFL